MKRSDPGRAPTHVCTYALPGGTRLVDLFVNGVRQVEGRDYSRHGSLVRLHRPVEPYRPVGAGGNLLTALCATVLPSGDEIDAVVATSDGRTVVGLVPQSDDPAGSPVSPQVSRTQGHRPEATGSHE